MKPETTLIKHANRAILVMKTLLCELLLSLFMVVSFMERVGCHAVEK